jgi:hypothetical protein
MLKKAVASSALPIWLKEYLLLRCSPITTCWNSISLVSNSEGSFQPIFTFIVMTSFLSSCTFHTMFSSGMWCCVDLVWTDVSEEHISSIFRVEKSASKEPAWAGSCRLSNHLKIPSYIRTGREEEWTTWKIIREERGRVLQRSGRKARQTTEEGGGQGQ